MKNQLVLFKLSPLETEQVAVWMQLTPEQREVAAQLLAELMARSLVGGSGERSGGSGRGQGDD